MCPPSESSNCYSSQTLVKLGQSNQGDSVILLMPAVLFSRKKAEASSLESSKFSMLLKAGEHIAAYLSAAIEPQFPTRKHEFLVLDYSM